MVILSMARTVVRGVGFGLIFVGSKANDSGVIDGMGCATGADATVGDEGGGAAGVQAAKSRANASKANQRNVMWTFILTLRATTLNRRSLLPPLICACSVLLSIP